MAEHAGLPVAGYTTQSDERVAMVNQFKQREEEILRLLDAMGQREEIDKRWLAIGRTQLEQAFMAINRSVFRPQRVAFNTDQI